MTTFDRRSWIVLFAVIPAVLLALWVGGTIAVAHRTAELRDYQPPLTHAEACHQIYPVPAGC